MLIKLFLLTFCMAALHAAPQRRTPADCLRNSKVPGHNLRLSYVGDAGGYHKETRYECINKCMANDLCMSIDYKDADEICHLNTEEILEEDIGQHEGWQYCTRRNIAARQFTTRAPATTPRDESEEESYEESAEVSEETDLIKNLLRVLDSIRESGEKSHKGSTEYPEQRSEEASGEESFEGSAESPEQRSEEASGEESFEGSAESTEQRPEEASGEESFDGSAESPEQRSEEASGEEAIEGSPESPEQRSEEASGEEAFEGSAESTEQRPEEASGEEAFEGSAESPEQRSEEASGEESFEGSAESPEQRSEEASGEESFEGSAEYPEQTDLTEKMYEKLLARILNLRVGDNYYDLDAPRPANSAECIPDSKVPGNNLRDHAGNAGGYSKENRYQCITKCMETDTCMSIEFKESTKICHLNTEVISEADIGQAEGWTYCTRRNINTARQLTTAAEEPTTPPAEHTTPRDESEEKHSDEESDEEKEDEFYRQLLNVLEARINSDRNGAECIEDSKVPGNNIRLAYAGDAGGYEKATRFQCVTKCMNTDTCMSIDYKDDICHLNTKVIDEEDIGQHEGWSYCPRRPE